MRRSAVTALLITDMLPPPSTMAHDQQDLAMHVPNIIQSLGADEVARFKSQMLADVAEIVARHGVEAMLASQADAAAHEAGHCIACAGIGWPLEWVMLSWGAGPYGSGTNWGGYTQCVSSVIAGVGDHVSPEANMRFLVFTLAGFCGENVVGRGSRPGSSLDEFYVGGIICGAISRLTGMQEQDIMREAMGRIDRLLRDNLTIARGVAKQLRLAPGHRIEGDDLRALVRGVNNCAVRDIAE